MEERLMTNEQFRAIVAMLKQIVRYAPDIDEAIRRIDEIEQKLKREKTDND
ncbi:MAG: hypothetical protein LBO82_04190 [Synergistaceae bacterium]|jgi:hypothetical protein|nr:hypothetical protein [Synergistaceae bacterium]